MICAQAVVHFRPNKSYEKYMKLLVSIMILVQIFQPLGKLLHGDEQEELWDRVSRFQDQLDRGMEQAQGQAARSEEILEEMTLRQVQEWLEQEDGQGDGMSWEDGTEVGFAPESGSEEMSSLETNRIPPVEKVEPVRIE